MGFLDLSMVKQLTLLFFSTFFFGVILWAFFSHRAKQFKSESLLPLEEGQLATTPTSNLKEQSNV